MNAASPTTLGDWLQAYRDGASPRELLGAWWLRLSATPLEPL
jgi:hypothetical protein